jgi:hypothetical protein
LEVILRGGVIVDPNEHCSPADTLKGVDETMWTLDEDAARPLSGYTLRMLNQLAVSVVLKMSIVPKANEK